MSKATLLLVDDDRHILNSMSEWLREQGYQVDTASGHADAMKSLARRGYDLLLADVRLGDGDGFELLTQCRQTHPDMAVILLTGYGHADMAVEAIQLGAFDFLTKPLIDDELEMSIQRALTQRRVIAENQNLKAQLDLRFGLENVIGHDHRMLKVFDLIESVADTKVTMLITGESGTGKSLIARAIHRRSARRDKPFVEVACGALPETLLESELFGHAAGAFTGATGDRLGKFALADGGTIFLDEIGTATASMQVKLLRVLQEFEFEQVGGSKTFKVDSRVILATNENLSELVGQGRFRQDLYYRINVINIELPPLRERIADIPLLAKHFLEEVCQESGRQARGFAPEALAVMQGYRWPGNVRELQNVVERAVLLSKSDTIRIDDLPPALAMTAPATVVAPLGARTLKQALEAPERQIILEVLESHHWNRQLTAEQLGINRTTLYKKMKRLGLEDHPKARETAQVG
ncbi:MAG: sigma-54 dependent transcriptional regulator [Pirellulales bacterium]|nr:sigma-54 dependent transcriptional regulator [Pirellulales bacterium]